MNILDLLKEQLGGQLAGKLGAAVGESEEDAKGAMDGMLGSILGSLVGKASTPEGAEDLSKQLDGHDGSLLDSIGDVFSGGKQTEIAESGGGILGSLLGDKLGAVGEALARVSGMKAESVQGMLKMLAPLVMGFLAKMKKSQGLDAGGLASLLMSQKDNVGAVMPAGMSGAMGLKDDLFAKISDPAPVSAAAAEATDNAAASGSNLLMMLLPLVIVGVLGYFAYSYITTGEKDDEGEEVTAPQPKPPGLVATAGGGGPGAGGAAPDLSLPEIDGLGDLGGEFDAAFKEAIGALSSVTDKESATEAATKLTDVTGQLDTLKAGFDKLPDAAKTSLTEHFTAKVIPGINTALNQLRRIPGVPPILQPVIDSLIEKVRSFAA